MLKVYVDFSRVLHPLRTLFVPLSQEPVSLGALTYLDSRSSLVNEVKWYCKHLLRYVENKNKNLCMHMYTICGIIISAINLMNVLCGVVGVHEDTCVLIQFVKIITGLQEKIMTGLLHTHIYTCSDAR